MTISDSTKALQAAELFSTRGLVAVITGGGSGIGRMITRTLAANGASKIYILGRRIEALHETAKQFPESVVPVECDVTSKNSLQRAAAKVYEETGYINVLWCNSGTSGPESPELTNTSSLDEFIECNWKHSVDDYAETFKVNTAGFWYSSIAFLKLLDLGNQRGSYRSQIVATCSTLGFGRFAPTGRFAYGQSKASQTHLMKQLSTHLVPYGIRANIVAPGLFPTDMTTAMTGSGYDVSKLIPEGRAGSESDIAGVVLFVTSKAGAYLNGNVVVCDGGRLSVVPSTY